MIALWRFWSAVAVVTRLQCTEAALSAYGAAAARVRRRKVGQ